MQTKGILMLFFFMTSLLYCQNPKGFDDMAKEMAKSETPIIKKEEVKRLEEKGKKIIFLDAREKEEYLVSHIEGAFFIGYSDFSINKMKNKSKENVYVVYCSVGYRSGKIGEKLKKEGYTNVFNLYGGIFDWKNGGFPVTNGKKEVDQVHPYNKKWGKWLKEEYRSKE